MKQPLCRIIHISDPHVVVPGNAHKNRKRAVALAYKLAYGVVPQMRPLGFALLQGFGGHEPMALVQFRRALAGALATTTRWPSSILLATGDLSTWGDAPAIDSAVKFVESTARDFKLDALLLYGNHDAWPGQLPFFATSQAVQQQERALSARGSFTTMPGPRGVQLFRVPTVIHDRVLNTFATGNSPASTWTRWPATLPGSVRIALTHHPVGGPQSSIAVKDLQNAVDVAKALHDVHLVISGHTHECHPSFGALPSAPPTGGRNLGQSQLQLTISTLSQRRFQSDEEVENQHFALYELFAGDGELELHRTLFERGVDASGLFVRRAFPSSALSAAERFVRPL